MHTPPPVPRESLLETAARLWPGDAAMRTRWLDAVALVRRTHRGWLLDTPVQPIPPGARHARPV